MATKYKDSGIYWIEKVPIDWELVPAKRIFNDSKRIVGDKANDYDRLALTMQSVILEISIPDIILATQQRIANYLNKNCAEIDKLIAIKQQKIEALKEYKKSVIYEYVTGKKEVEC